MNLGKFFAELKRRNVYKVAIPVVAWPVDQHHHSLLVRLDHVACVIVNANHSIM